MCWIKELEGRARAVVIRRGMSQGEQVLGNTEAGIALSQELASDYCPGMKTSKTRAEGEEPGRG